MGQLTTAVAHGMMDDCVGEGRAVAARAPEASELAEHTGGSRGAGGVGEAPLRRFSVLWARSPWPLETVSQRCCI